MVLAKPTCWPAERHVAIGIFSEVVVDGVISLRRDEVSLSIAVKEVVVTSTVVM